MLKVHLPDGKVVDHPDGATAAEVLRAVSSGLARQAVAAKVNGQIVDLQTRLTGPDVTFRALLPNDPEGLQVMRHSCAHVMAEAVCASGRRPSSRTARRSRTASTTTSSSSTA